MRPRRALSSDGECGAPVGTSRRAWLESGLAEDAFEDLSGRVPAFEGLTPVPETLVRIGDQTVTLAAELAAEGSEVLGGGPS
jgi:hypothetical protein